MSRSTTGTRNSSGNEARATSSQVGTPSVVIENDRAAGQVPKGAGSQRLGRPGLLTLLAVLRTGLVLRPLVEARLELLLGLAQGARELRDLGPAEDDQHD